MPWRDYYRLMHTEKVNPDLHDHSMSKEQQKEVIGKVFRLQDNRYEKDFLA